MRSGATRSRIAQLVAIVAVGLGAATAPVAAAGAAGAAGAAAAATTGAVPRLRLPATASPLHYRVELTLVPAVEKFSGAVAIDLLLEEPTAVLWLNATALTIEAATLTAGSTRLAAGIVPGGDDFVGFSFARPIPAGRARLEIRFSGEVSSIETRGLFRQSDGGSWYLYSQFEATDARRAFPCFDEPGFKTPWELTLHVRREDTAVANTPVLSETAEPGEMKKVVFATTPPLPSYLVALGVGPFEIVDAGHAGRKSTPIRIIVPRGHAKEAWYAVETSAPMLDLLEHYLGTAFPYAKLDNLVIPQTVGFGAMENAGLITYAASIVLAKPDEATLRFKRRYVGAFAHEAAHQWFGDLVTPKWWDDAWLNESFASWLGTKIEDRFRPAWSAGVEPIASRDRGARSDTIVSARQIRQPVTSKHDVENAFDSITYAKGQAVLQMFEGWMGEERFQAGVRRYLAAHAFGSATAEDFVGALAAGGDAAIRPAFFSFLTQPGLPEVGVELRCAQGHGELELSQRRFLPLGSTGTSSQLWQVPVCVRYGGGTRAERACTLLVAARQTLPLAGSSCPEWVLGNAGGLGYYRVDYRGGLLAKLLGARAAALTLPERVAALNDAAALVETGEIPLQDALALVAVHGHDADRQVVEATIEIAVRPRDLLPEKDRPRYARFVEAVYGERARALGLTSSPADDDAQALRDTLVAFVGDSGHDPRLLADATTLAHRWLADRRSVRPAAAGLALRLAALHGDTALFDRFRAAALASADRRERTDLLTAMGSFEDPRIVARAEALILTPGLDPREAIAAILGAQAANPAVLEERYRFIKSNFAALAAKLPRDMPARFPWLVRGFCDEEHRADVEAFF
ncbi:MAG TPA: M1 family metallopeptidase, partial [Thermoanaerobaculia bacterium]|nr:M1 family metallopeptidase [Thermoanaerobaculia bacterium]